MVDRSSRRRGGRLGEAEHGSGLNSWGVAGVVLAMSSIAITVFARADALAILVALLAGVCGCVGIRGARLYGRSGDGVPLVAVLLALVGIVTPFRRTPTPVRLPARAVIASRPTIRPETTRGNRLLATEVTHSSRMGKGVSHTVLPVASRKVPVLPVVNPGKR